MAAEELVYKGPAEVRPNAGLRWSADDLRVFRINGRPEISVRWYAVLRGSRERVDRIRGSSEDLVLSLPDHRDLTTSMGSKWGLNGTSSTRESGESAWVELVGQGDLPDGLIGVSV